MKPVLLLIAIYSLIFQQYQQRKADQQKKAEIKASPSPKPVITIGNEGDSAFAVHFRMPPLFNTTSFYTELPPH